MKINKEIYSNTRVYMNKMTLNKFKFGYSNYMDSMPRLNWIGSNAPR